MFSLLIDSHSKELNIVLYKDKKVYQLDNYIFNNQSKIIIPKILELLNTSKISFKDISEVIVVNGPGSFTGTRLGVTIAKTISYCQNIPIMSISTILLYGINVNIDSNYSIAIPDQKGYFIGEFDKNNQLISDYFYLSKDDYLEYKNNHHIIDDIDIDWNNIYKYDCLKKEDCYNIKPLYIKKIEVEK